MQVDWDRVGQEGVALLQELLRFDTTNPPGNELPLARCLEDRLKAEGFDPQILESAPSRANLVVRLNGTGRERPVLLLSHTDVVPAEPGRWTHPPFAGQVADGYVWGRGAFDSKLTVVVGIQVLRLCRRLDLPLERDLVVVAAADEEMERPAASGGWPSTTPRSSMRSSGSTKEAGTPSRSTDVRSIPARWARKGARR